MGNTSSSMGGGNSGTGWNSRRRPVVDGVTRRAAWEEEILVPDGIQRRRHRILDGVTRRAAWEEEILVPDGIQRRRHRILDGVHVE